MVLVLMRDVSSLLPGGSRDKGNMEVAIRQVDLSPQECGRTHFPHFKKFYGVYKNFKVFIIERYLKIIKGFSHLHASLYNHCSSYSKRERRQKEKKQM